MAAAAAAAASSSSSGSSFTSSSLGRPPAAYGRSYTSPAESSSWTPTSGISSLSVPSTSGSGAFPGTPYTRGSQDPQTSLQTLDLGPPGYQATITLFHDTPDERTIYLGPWDLVGSEQRRIVWQCSYQYELLEHYLPSNVPTDIHPHTLHSRHRQYHDPADMERYLTFNEPHRVRYTSDDGVCIHDELIQVRYEFSTVESSMQFQGDVRGKDLMGIYDTDVCWTNLHGRTDSYGKVKGIGAIQRLKLWRDRYTTFHSLSVLANKTDGQYHEYDVCHFDEELRGVDDRIKQVRLQVHSRRSSDSTTGSSRRLSFAQRMLPRGRSGRSDQANPDQRAPSSQSAIDIKYLAIQFSSRQDYRRFLQSWPHIRALDRGFQGVPYPPNHFELPSPEMLPVSGQAEGLASPEGHQTLESVDEPVDPYDQG